MRAPGSIRLALPLLLTWCVTARAQDGPPVAPPPQVRAWQTGALRPDRLQHASLALTVGLGAGLATRRPGAACGTALGLGVVKELRDLRAGGRFDLADLLADTVGAALATIVTRALD
jgi:VanZ family protein